VEETWGDAGLTSEEEVIRAMYDALASRDIDAFSERLHPDVVWEHNIGGGSLEEGTYRGRENVLRLFERVFEPWEHMRVEPEEIKHSDAGALLIRGKMHSKHATTEAEIVTPYEQRFEVEDGLLIRAQMTFGPLSASPEA
jgi:ketosteroid isomerase-like protein